MVEAAAPGGGTVPAVPRVRRRTAPGAGRGAARRARRRLDAASPAALGSLAEGSFADAVALSVEGGRLVVALPGGRKTGLAAPSGFAGYQGDAARPTSVLFQHNGIHLDLQINRNTPIGATDPAGVCDLVVEAALSSSAATLVSCASVRLPVHSSMFLIVRFKRARFWRSGLSSRSCSSTTGY